MQCKEVENVLEQEGLVTLPAAARAHLAECSKCRDYVADLMSIVTTARELPADVEPPARIWASLLAQLEQEGIIKTPAAGTVVKGIPWWRTLGEFFRSRALATATVGLLILSAAVLQIRTDHNLSSVPGATPEVSPVIVSPTVPITQTFNDTATALNEQEKGLSNMYPASTSPVDSSLWQSLQTVDEFIAECENHLKQAPQDELAREYLASAYEQKAELLSAMIDRGRSVN